jgi:hydrogenase-4 component E
MTLGLKALFIPWLLHRFIQKLALERHVEGLPHTALVLMTGVALVVFSYWASLPIEQLGLAATRNIIAVSLSIVLLGLLMMVARRTAVVQVIGFMSMGNGLFLAAVTTAHGMPMLVELGVAFDVMVAAILFGMFFLQIQESIDSLDVDKLNRLTEREEDT